MPLPSDLQQLVETITISNLSQLVSPTPSVSVPLGFQQLFTTTVVNHFNDLGLAPDLQQILDATIPTGLATIITTP